MDNFTKKHLQIYLIRLMTLKLSDLVITNARKIVDARNYIIHDYDSLSVDILWSIVVNHLPHLKSEVEKLLQESSRRKTK